MASAPADDTIEQRSLADRQMEALSWAFAHSDAGDIIVAHEGHCYSLTLGADCSCRPKIFMVPDTKGYRL